MTLQLTQATIEMGGFVITDLFEEVSFIAHEKVMYCKLKPAAKLILTRISEPLIIRFVPYTHFECLVEQVTNNFVENTSEISFRKVLKVEQF